MLFTGGYESPVFKIPYETEDNMIEIRLKPGQHLGNHQMRQIGDERKMNIRQTFYDTEDEVFFEFMNYWPESVDTGSMVEDLSDKEICHAEVFCYMGKYLWVCLCHSEI